jgi:hypothetical protein
VKLSDEEASTLLAACTGAALEVDVGAGAAALDGATAGCGFWHAVNPLASATQTKPDPVFMARMYQRIKRLATGKISPLTRPLVQQG